MQFTAQDISLMLNGTIEGDPQAAISRLAKIEEATDGMLSFLANPKYEQHLYNTQASVVIVNNSLVLTGAVKPTLIRERMPIVLFQYCWKNITHSSSIKQALSSPALYTPLPR